MNAQVSSQEAEEALKLADQTARRMRRMLGEGTMWAYLVIWGTVWALGFLGDAFLPPAWTGRAWIALDGIGIVLSFGLGLYYGQRFRVRHGAQMGLFWLAWLVYGGLIVSLARPQSAFQVGVLVTTLAMFAYVVLAIWARSTLLGGLGLVITVCTLAAYYLWPAGFNFVMALVGLGMLASGIYMHQAWR